MLQRELTFRCRRALTLPDARHLYRLAGRLQARIHLQLYNVTRRRQSDGCEPLSLMALGSRSGDLCQLIIRGKDAELATIVLTSWVNELGACLGGRHADFAPAQLQLQQLAPELDFHVGMMGTLQAGSDQSAALQQLVALLPEAQVRDRARLCQQLQAREAIASTALCPGIALPHALSPEVTRPMLALLDCPSPLDWHSPFGAVQLLLLMVLPAPATASHLQPLQRLVRQLMDPWLQQALLNDHHRAARHALLIQALAPQAD